MDSDELASRVLGPVEVALFENLYAAYWRDARAAAMAMVGDPEQGIDVVHDAFVQIFRSVLAGGRWLDPADARAMVLRNTRWAAHKALRTRSRKRRLDVPLDAALGEPGEDDWARWEARALCEQITERLPDSQRRALQLRYMAGLGATEAARRLGISIAAYEKRVARGLKAARGMARGWAVAPWTAVLDRVTRRASTPRTHRAPRRSSFLGARGPASVGAAVAAACAVMLSLGSWSGAALPTEVIPAAQHGAGASAAPAESVDDAVIDAVAVARQQTITAVLVFGTGRACSCALGFRSVDRGRTWQRLTLAADPRRSLRRTVEAMEPGASVEVASCSRTAVNVLCDGRVVMPVPAPRDAGRHTPAGGDEVLLLFSPAAGVLCSIDGGQRWTPRCGAVR